jgi:hypothetical protein
MLPVGGSQVWGNASFAPDDDEKITAAGRSYGCVLLDRWQLLLLLISDADPSALRRRLKLMQQLLASADPSPFVACFCSWLGDYGGDECIASSCLANALGSSNVADFQCHSFWWGGQLHAAGLLLLQSSAALRIKNYDFVDVADVGACRGIIARIHSVDDKLGDAVSKNDSSLISSESLQLLRKTLSNWGSVITSLGSSDSEADQIAQEDEEEEAEDRLAAAGKLEQHGNEPGRQPSKPPKKPNKHAGDSSKTKAYCHDHDCGAGEVTGDYITHSQQHQPAGDGHCTCFPLLP